MRTISIEQRRRRVGHRHALAQPDRTPSEAARRLVGFHATDPATVYLSARARVAGFTIGDLDDALYESRGLVRVLGMRRTLFVVPAGYEPVLRKGCAERYLNAEVRRLTAMLDDQHGHDATWLNRVLTKTVECLQDSGRATAGELKEEIPELETKLTFGEGKKWGGEIGLVTRVLFILSTRGQIVRGRPRGSWLSGQYEWAPRAGWIGIDDGDCPDGSSRALLATEWLRGFGPGTEKDLQWWTGWNLSETRAALASISAEPVDLGGDVGYVLPGDETDMAAVRPWARLLPALDPTPMGWKERNWYLGAHTTHLFDRSGNIGPTVWANGRVVGGWGQRTDGKIVTVLLEPVSPDEQFLIDKDAAALEAWLDGTVIKPRFRTPLEKRIQAG